MGDEARVIKGFEHRRIASQSPEDACVVVDHHGGQEVQPGGTNRLAIGGAVLDLALMVQAKRSLEGMMRLASVEADLLPALKGRIGQPGQDIERALDPADFTERDRQGVALWVGCELAQKVARADHARGHGRGDPQDLRPAIADHLFPCPATDQRLEGWRNGLVREDGKPLIGQVADPGGEQEAKNRGDGKDMVGEAPGVGEVLPNPAARVRVQEAVDRVLRRPWR